MIKHIDRHITKNQAFIKNKNKADDRYIKFQQEGPKGAVLHSIGDEQPSARVIADYFDNPKVEASVHMVLQPDGQCYCLAPDNYRLWHVGGSANNTHMGIEMTEPGPDCIWYDENYRVHIKDKAKALAHVQQTYTRAVELFAALSIQYGWDPLEDGVILSHKECYERGIGSNHGDPEHLWDALETGYTMDGFRRDVAKLAEEIKAAEKAETDHTGKEETEVRYETLADLKADPKSKFYLPTVEKLIQKGYLKGKGGTGDDLILDFSEDSIRILVTLDRAGVYGE